MHFVRFSATAFFLVGSWLLFLRLVSMEKCKSNFKIGSHGTIYTFKNYFATVFSALSGIQTDPSDHLTKIILLTYFTIQLTFFFLSTVLSVKKFQFQQNKQIPNEPLFC